MMSVCRGPFALGIYSTHDTPNCAPLLDNYLYVQVEQLKISTNQRDCCIKLRYREVLFINENYFRKNKHQQETYRFHN